MNVFFSSRNRYSDSSSREANDFITRANNNRKINFLIWNICIPIYSLFRMAIIVIALEHFCRLRILFSRPVDVQILPETVQFFSLFHFLSEKGKKLRVLWVSWLCLLWKKIYERISDSDSDFIELYMSYYAIVWTLNDLYIQIELNLMRIIIDWLMRESDSVHVIVRFVNFSFQISFIGHRIVRFLSLRKRKTMMKNRNDLWNYSFYFYYIIA